MPMTLRPSRPLLTTKILILLSFICAAYPSGARGDASEAPNPWYRFSKPTAAPGAFTPLSAEGLAALQGLGSDEQAILVLVHGRCDNEDLEPCEGRAAVDTMQELAEAIASEEPKLYHTILAFSYDPYGDFNDAGREFAAAMSGLGAVRKHVVAHSLGGLVARGLQQATVAHHTAVVVSLGSPHLGIDVPQEVRNLLPFAAFMGAEGQVILSLLGLFRGSEAMRALQSDAPAKFPVPSYQVVQGRITRPRPSLPLSQILMGLVYSARANGGVALANDGIVPCLTAESLKEALPGSTVQVHDFVGTDHNQLISKDFAVAALLPLLRKAAP